MTGCFYLVMYREGHVEYCKYDMAFSRIFLTEEEALRGFAGLMSEMQLKNGSQQGEYYMDVALLRLTSGESLPEGIEEVLHHPGSFNGLMHVVQMTS